MARAATVMSEDDDDDDRHDADTAHVDIPDGLSGSSDTPHPRASETQTEPEYTIVDTDDDFQPLSGPAAPQREEIREEEPADVDANGRPRERLSGAARRKANRLRERAAEAELRKVREENARLSSRVDDLTKTVTPRLDQIEQHRYDERLSGLTREIEAAARTVDDAITRMSEAVMAGDGAAHAAALREHTKATQRGYELATQRQQLESSQTDRGRQQPADRQDTRQPTPQRSAPRPVDPVVQERIGDFSKQFSWLQINLPPEQRDLDTVIAMRIDNQVASEGFDPQDDDYWEELESRMRAAPQLAHRFQSQTRQPEPRRQNGAAPQPQRAPERRGPMVGGAGNGSSAGGGPRKVLLSPERKTALMQAGILDVDGTILDRSRFDRIAKGYVERDRDRANGVGATRQ